MRARGSVATLLLLLGAAGSRPAQETEDEAVQGGRGWSTVALDVDVFVHPERGELRTEGTVTVALTGLDESAGPLLLLSTQRTPEGLPAIAFEHLDCASARCSVLDEPFAGRWQQAFVSLAEPARRGDRIEIHFACRSTEAVRRMIVHPAAAMADWINAWLPFPLPDRDGDVALAPRLFRAPGRTTLHLPAGWSGLVDGELVERRDTPPGVEETWRTPPGLARGFVAGPYSIVTERVDGRDVQVYLLDESRVRDAELLAERLGQAIAAQESVLGPFPVPGAFRVVDFPRLPGQSFGAVGEQTYVVVQPPNLDYAFQNIQLLAHEVAHAWWGNSVGTDGPGAKWCSESLAEMGALLAIERLEGHEAMLRFLELGRTGTDPTYCAAGYFALVRQGSDLPLATMGFAPASHAIANSKGVWVLHMLREELGAERFGAVLANAAAELAGRELTADGLRARFARAAPELELEGFFSQWLDRTGAPILDLDWHASIDGEGLLLRLRQLQEGEPFDLDLELEIRLDQGGPVRERVSLDSRERVFELATPARPVAILLDPDRKVLLWRPEYGPRPGSEIPAESLRVPDDLLRAVVGSYRFTGMEKDVEVFARDGFLYLQPAGAPAVRLLPGPNGVFGVDAPGGMSVEFDLSRVPVQSFVSVEGGGRERYPAERRAEPQAEPDLGWERVPLEEVGLDGPRLFEIVRAIESFPQQDFRALLIARHGLLAFEEYFNGQEPDTLTDIRSAGKSVTSTLVGIAIDQGLIPGVDSEVLPYFETHAPHENTDDRKRRITIGDLLTMRSGLDAVDGDPSSPGSELAMQRTPDWIEHTLDLPMKEEPGTRWVYSGASSMLLVGILEAVTGGDVLEFAQRNLFDPLGVAHLRWMRTPRGRIVGQGSLFLTARDALKLGQVFLSGGTWKGRRIVSPAWIAEATRMHVDLSEYQEPQYAGYGFQWWCGRYDVGGRRLETYFASGNGGNKIQVVPALDLVVVLLSTAYDQAYGDTRSHDLFLRVLAAVDPE